MSFDWFCFSEVMEYYLGGCISPEFGGVLAVKPWIGFMGDAK